MKTYINKITLFFLYLIIEISAVVGLSERSERDQQQTET